MRRGNFKWVNDIYDNKYISFEDDPNGSFLLANPPLKHALIRDRSWRVKKKFRLPRKLKKKLKHFLAYKIATPRDLSFLIEAYRTSKYYRTKTFIN